MPEGTVGCSLISPLLYVCTCFLSRAAPPGTLRKAEGFYPRRFSRRKAISRSGTRAYLRCLPRCTVEGGAHVAHVGPHARQRFESKAPGNQLEDGGRVVGRVIDVAALGQRRDDEGRNAR